MPSRVRAAIGSLASRGRSTEPLLVGLGVTAAAVLASALVARRHSPAADDAEVYSDYQALGRSAFSPPRPVFSLIWPPLFLALVSGLRMWRAPKVPAPVQGFKPERETAARPTIH